MGFKSVVRGRGGMEEGEEEVVSSIPGGAGSPASHLYVAPQPTSSIISLFAQYTLCIQCKHLYYNKYDVKDSCYQ